MLLQANPNLKFDIMSYRAYKKVILSYTLFQILLFAKVLLLLIFVPINALFLTETLNNITIFMIPLLIVAFLDLSWNLALYFLIIKNNKLALQVCISTNHVVQQPDNSDIVSRNMYNAENQTQINNQGLTSDLMKRYENLMGTIIQQSLLNSVPSLLRSINYAKASTFLLFALTIMMLFIAQPTNIQIVVLSIYQFLVFTELIKVFLIILVILFLPLIVCSCCFYICCCVNPTAAGGSQQSLLVPPPTAANQQILANTQNTCPICYQNLQYGQQVLVLPCSDKHVFHQMCISTWLAVSPTCPQCRHKLRVTA